MRRKVAVAALLVLVVLLLTACGGPEDTYKQAQELLSKGKYSEAAEKFESLGSYEDASTLTMYCKACALCESGNFETGIAAFESLRDFKDSKMRITYYTARSWDDGSVGTTEYEWMERARSIYNEIPLYLDSADRITALNTRIEKAKTDLYNAAVNAGESGKYTTAIDTFKRLGYYKDSQDRYEYYGIRKDEAALANSTDQDAIIAVAKQYSNKETYLDCVTRADTLNARADEIVTNKYAKVSELITEGKYAEAETILASFGRYGSEQVTANYYTIAEKYLAQGAWDQASAAFKKAGKYSDASRRINEPFYKQAEALMAEGKWDEASAAFKRAGEYSNASDRVKEPFYRQAEALLAQGNVDEAIAAFDNAGDYSNARDRIVDLYYKEAEALMTAKKWVEASNAFCKACPYGGDTNRINEPFYKQAETLLSEDKFDEAIAAFINAGNYRDAPTRIKETYYRKAEALFNSGKWDEAATAFLNAGDYSDAATRLYETYYIKAEKMMQAGSYKEAYEAYKTANGYKDSAEKASIAFAASKQVEWANVSVGDYITFGSYEQDTYGKKDIEWLVVSKTDSSMLVLSRYVLDFKTYESYEKNFSWKTCSLRKWLNEDFVKAAFLSEESALLLPTIIPSADKSNTTIDNVFLLGVDDVKMLSEKDRKASTIRGTKEDWYLRTILVVNKSNTIAFVSESGEIPNYLSKSPNSWAGIRPAMMLNLKPIE